jgi:hypothetical protein
VKNEGVVMKWLLFLSLILGESVWACQYFEKSFNADTYQKQNQNYSEQDFNQTLDRIDRLYSPLMRDAGGQLVIERDWNETMVNGFARRERKNFIIRILGGLLRHKTATLDSFLLVVCHELAHHLGGAPKKREWFKSSWSSVEGQADYWAAVKCMKRYYQDLDTSDAWSLALPDSAVKKCREVYSTRKDQEVCLKTLHGGLIKTLFYQRHFPNEPSVSFLTPDLNRVRKTSNKHPAPQCRLDTTFQGALCDRSFDIPVSDTDSRVGQCHDGNRALIGARPLCWYRPEL